MSTVLVTGATGTVGSVANAIDAAARAGVQRLVKLSALGAEPGSPLAFWDAHGRIEGLLERAGIPAVVLRPTFYMSNLLASAEAVRSTRRLFLPAGDAKVAMIDPRDVAAAAAAALMGAGEGGRRFHLTGPEAVTFSSVADELSDAVGYPVELVDVPDDAARAAMVEAGMPEWAAANLVTLFGFLRQGAQASTTEDFGRLTGRQPRTVGQFARDHAQLFAR
ncbi:MAG TPA: NmrA family NAD(P)-binding protein [Acidimicrobiales bacterium]|nr:NmrA family NAD(P)-binding protein [Acidimicrobiales bacterium]